MIWGGVNLIILAGAGLFLLVLGARREPVPVREALIRFLDERAEQERLGPPQVSPSRLVLLQLAALAAGGAVGFFLLPFHRPTALAAGVGVGVMGVLLSRRLSGGREKKEAAEDVLALLAHLRQMLSRGTKSREALRTFAAEVEPGRALARRIEGCLATVDVGGADLYAAFEMWVAQDNPHLQALSDLLREVNESPDPRATLERLSRKVLRDLQREMRFAGKRRALAGIVVTVAGLFPALMLALLEPTIVRMANSILF